MLVCGGSNSCGHPYIHGPLERRQLECSNMWRGIGVWEEGRQELRALDSTTAARGSSAGDEHLLWNVDWSSKLYSSFVTSHVGARFEASEECSAAVLVKMLH